MKKHEMSKEKIPAENWTVKLYGLMRNWFEHPIMRVVTVSADGNIIIDIPGWHVGKLPSPCITDTSDLPSDRQHYYLGTDSRAESYAHIISRQMPNSNEPDVYKKTGDTKEADGLGEADVPE